MKSYREQALDLATGYSSGLNLLKGSGFFDLMKHAGIYNYFKYEDIILLNELAINPAYTIKSNRSKFWLYDQIIVPRGFTRTHSGTNRIVYSCNNDDSFIVKVGLDKIGVNDNKSEMKNQNILKPFIPKVFDVSKCGTVLFMEKVHPILNREEFSTYANSIFNVLTYIVEHGYILEDIGTDFFMNWGIRKNFGPVLLDFPYIYRVNKYRLKCIRRNTDGSVCGGKLEYDDGFNYILCKKCGKRYGASTIGSSFNYLNEIKGKLRRTQTMSFKLRITTNNKNVVTETGTTVIPNGNNIINKINENNNNISTGGGYINPISEKKNVLKINDKFLSKEHNEVKKEVKLPKGFKKKFDSESSKMFKFVPPYNTIEPRVVELLETKFNMSLDSVVNNRELMLALKKSLIENADKFLEKRHYLIDNAKLKSFSEEEYEDFKVNKLNKILRSDKYKIIDTGIYTDFITNFVFFNTAKFLDVLSEAIEEYTKITLNNENKKEEPIEQPVKQEEFIVEPPKKLEMELSNASPLSNPVITQDSATTIVAEMVNNGVKKKLSDEDF